MQRRLDIATALVHRPRVLFLDEPTTGLDPEVRAAMWLEIARLAREEGVTILLTTHYLEEADQLAARWPSSTTAAWWPTGAPDELKAELRGDAIQVELRDVAQNGDVPGALAGLEGVGDVTVDGRTAPRPRGRRRDGRPGCHAARWRRAASPSRPSPSRARRSTMSTCGRPAAPSRTPTGGSPMTTVLRQAGYMGPRTCAPCPRQPWSIAITLVQPVIWLLLYGALFKRVRTSRASTAGPTSSSSPPGVVVMTALFSTGWSGMGMINDLDHGRRRPLARLARAPER